jgi:hypothetical protein
MVHYVPVHFLGDRVEFHAFGLVHGIKEGWKRVAQGKTPATTVTDVKNALEFLLEKFFVVERRALPL